VRSTLTTSQVAADWHWL